MTQTQLPDVTALDASSSELAATVRELPDGTRYTLLKASGHLCITKPGKEPEVLARLPIEQGTLREALDAAKWMTATPTKCHTPGCNRPALPGRSTAPATFISACGICLVKLEQLPD